MKKAHSRTSLFNVHSETQKLRGQNATVLRSRNVRCLLSHLIIEFSNSRNMYALRTYFLCAKMERASFITARQRIGSDPTVISLSGISSAGLLTFLWVIHLNVGYNNNIFLYQGKECVRKQPSCIRSPSYFAALLQTLYFYYNKAHVVSFLQHLSWRGH